MVAQLNYTFQRLNSENGLPTNAIKGLQFDHESRFLWVATESGIVRYNGHSFQNFGDVALNENLNGRIILFDKNINGNYFGKLIDQSFFSIFKNKIIHDSKNKLIKSHSDYISYKYNLPEFKIKFDINTIEYNNFLFRNNVYLLTNNYQIQDLKRVTNGKLEHIKSFNHGEQGFILNERFFLLQKNGIISEVNESSTLKNQFKYFETLELLKNNQDNIQCRVFQNNPNEEVYILFGTNLYQLKLELNKIKFELIINSIPKYEFIKFIQIDKLTNTFYFGTDNRGILVARPKYFNRILPNNFVNGVSTSTYAQVELSNGNIQINTGQIFGENKSITKSIFNRQSSTNTFIDNNNNLYFSNADGLSVYDLNNDKLSDITKGQFVNSNSFIQVGNVVYGINEYGVIKRVKNQKWESILRFIKIPLNFIVYHIANIGNNQLLVATTDGLYKYQIDKNTFTLFFRDKNKANFRTIYDLGGYFIIGTYGSGAYMYKSDTIKKMPLDQNGYYKYVHCYIEDDQERIWATTNKGIFMAPKQSLINFWKVGPGKIIYKYFGKSEGIDILEFNGGCSPCALKLKNGLFSIPGIDGLMQFNPSSIPNTIITPKVYLDKTLVDNVLSKDQQNEKIPSKVNRITLYFGIAGMLSEDNIRLEYKFDEDGTWLPLKINNPVLNIDKPSFGAHHVYIRSRSTYSPNWEIKKFSFNISIPWFLTPWMYLVYLALTIGFILLYIRFKTIIYQRRQILLEKEVSVKTASLNKLNSYLQKRNQAKDQVIAIMNHDLLTPLKYLHITTKNIGQLITDTKFKDSILQISKTTKDLEILTSNMLNWVKFDNLLTLKDKHSIDLYEFTNNLTDFVAPFIQNPDVKIINLIEPNKNLITWPDPLRVLMYNLLINAIKSTSVGSIEIYFKIMNNQQCIVIKDQGVGMSQSMIRYLITGLSEDGFENLPKYKNGNGIGYQIVRNIISLMNAKLDIESIEGKGTSVLIYLDK